MNGVDVFFTDRQGRGEGRPGRAARQLLARHVTRGAPRGERAATRRATGRRPGGAVPGGGGRLAGPARAALYERMIADELAPTTASAASWSGATRRCTTARCASWTGFDRIRERGGVEFEIVSVPGISSRAGAGRGPPDPAEPGRAAAFTVTTGRRLADEGPPAGRDDVVVMLDAVDAFASLPEGGAGWDIYWGAYLATPDEVLVHGTWSRCRPRSCGCAPSCAPARAGSWTPTCCAGGSDDRPAQRARARRHRRGAPARGRAAPRPGVRRDLVARRAGRGAGAAQGRRAHRGLRWGRRPGRMAVAGTAPTRSWTPRTRSRPG